MLLTIAHISPSISIFPTVQPHGNILDEIVKKFPVIFQNIAQEFHYGFLYNISTMCPQDAL